MNEHAPVDRRSFLRRSVAAASAAAMSVSFEEQILRAQQSHPHKTPAVTPQGKFPQGRLGPLKISRLICGGNLISGFAHSRDLIYVSPLLRHYFTDEKVFETLELCESYGINAAILRLDDHVLGILREYRRRTGSKLQWIAQVKINEKDQTTEPQRAIDHGAVAVYVHGGVGDRMVAEGRVDLLGKAIEHIRRNKVVAGIAGHDLRVHQTCERAGIPADFYMKTFNSKSYWSAGLSPKHDNIWEEDPEATRRFMQQVRKPWIAYKVLGAGAIHPREGFAYAFQHGADFICVGMFDFQVAEDVILAKQAIAQAQQRERPWCA